MNCEEISAILYNWQQKAKEVFPDVEITHADLILLSFSSSCFLPPAILLATRDDT
jgi:hypothetical protein